MTWEQTWQILSGIMGRRLQTEDEEAQFLIERAHRSAPNPKQNWQKGHCILRLESVRKSEGEIHELQY